MPEYIHDCKTTIDTHLTMILRRVQQELSGTGHFTDKVLTQLSTMSTQGKGVRGALCVYAAEMYGMQRNDTLMALAAGIELIHTSLLIHDDIIDRDTVRRGKPTIHMQYHDVAREHNIQDVHVFGNDMAMCVGDIGFFIAMHIVGKEHIHSAVQARILAAIGREIIKTGIAQMDDVFYGLRTDNISRAEIENVYRYKTARYTFSLPCMVGAMMAEQDDHVVDQLVALGESIGLIFQLRDDEMGLMSQEQDIGKSVGSDIRENKKTLMRYLLFKHADEDQRAQLGTCFGSPDITHEQIAYVRELYQSLGVHDQIHRIMHEHGERARQTIASLTIDTQWKDMLGELVAYVEERKK